MCGSCSYVCPAKRPLTQQIKAMRVQYLLTEERSRKVGNQSE